MGCKQLSYYRETTVTEETPFVAVHRGGKTKTLKKTSTIAKTRSHFAFTQVTRNSSNTHAALRLSEYEAPASGFIVLYLSNESRKLTEVYFDDLKINVTESKVVQRDDYYPFGLSFNSWKRSTTRENKYLYQGLYAEEDDFTGWYRFKLRNNDPTIARWTTTDPYDQFASPYLSMGGNPINFIDPDGGYSKFGAWWRNIFRGGSGIYKSGNEWGFNVANNTSYTVRGETIQGFDSRFGDKYKNKSKIVERAKNDWTLESYQNRPLATGAAQPFHIEFDIALAIGTLGSGNIIKSGASMAFGTRATVQGARMGVASGANKVKYIGRLEDLKGIPKSKTLLDDLPNLGTPKANYHQNMSVLRKSIRDGYTIKDASFFRPNSQLAPTLLNPNRTVGQTFLGAERLLLRNRGLWP